MEAPATEIRRQSPDYPAISLAECIERGQRLFEKIQTYPAGREIIATGIGFKSLNGASMSALAAFQKFGLLAATGKDLKFTELALKIFAPASPEEKTAAINKAAFTPTLFRELREMFHGDMPNEDLLKNNLLRRGFLSAPADKVISSYRDTLSLVSREAATYNPLKPVLVESPPIRPQDRLGAITVGDFVQWESGGVIHFESPRRVDWVSPSGQFVRVEGSATGIPMVELSKVEHRPTPPPRPANLPPLVEATPKSADASGLYRRVTMDGARIEVQAVVDAKELKKLMKVLAAAQVLLDEDDSPLD